MSNRLPNAGMLELTSGWAGSAGLTLAADEASRGAPGRCVLRAVGSTTSAGQTVKIWVDSARRAPAVIGTFEVSGWAAAFIAGVAVAPVVVVVFRNAGGTQTGATTIPVQAAALSQYGEARDGLAATYRRFWARLAPPAGTATADIEVRVTTPSAAAIEILLLKPFFDLVPAGQTNPLLWDPGVHIDADLQMPVWPGTLRPFQAAGGSQPRPGRVQFEAGPGRPASRRTAIDPARRFAGVTRCDAVQREALESFWRKGAGDFYVVEPDSDRLCVASWAADGQPQMTEVRGPTALMQVGLWLETA